MFWIVEDEIVRVVNLRGAKCNIGEILVWMREEVAVAHLSP